MEFVKELMFMNGNKFENYFNQTEIKSMVHLPPMFLNSGFINFLFPNIIMMFFSLLKIN